MKVVALVTCLVSGAVAHMHLAYPAKAWINPLTSNGASGYVEVKAGIVTTVLNLTNFDYAGAGLSPGLCNASLSPGGISYHIHAKYPASATPTSQAGAACGFANYGGHFDPWYACGGATDQRAACASTTCSSCTGCINRMVYNCTNANFLANPFSCEVGDWSGKYGKLMPMAGNPMVFTATTAANRYEITSLELYGTMRSVVFHCGSLATRVLCAPFLPDNTSALAEPGAPVQGIAAATTAGTRMVADFGGLAIRGPAIELGGGELHMDAVSVAKFAKFLVGCGGLLSIPAPQINAAPWNSTAMGGDAFAGTMGECSSAMVTGGILDPGVRCVPGSSMSALGYCFYNQTSGVNLRCPALGPSAISLNYTDDIMRSKYNAAQGTLVIPPSILQGASMGATLAFPYLDERALLGKSISIVCLNNPMIGWCAKIKPMPQGYTYLGRTAMPTKGPTGSPTKATTGVPTASPVVMGPGSNSGASQWRGIGIIAAAVAVIVMG